MSDVLSGISVLVAGAGLAGLCAARDLAAHGADVIVVDARDRVGGRVVTCRTGFVDGQHAEYGADMIDEEHRELRQLIAELGLRPVRILDAGFGQVRRSPGSSTPVRRSSAGGWKRLASSLAPLVHRYRLAERRWDTPIAAELGRHSVAGWLSRTGADDELQQMATSLRGFFLADPDELSLLALVDQFSWDTDAGSHRMYRIDGGNDRLTTAIGAALGARVHLGTELVALSQRGRRVRATVKEKKQNAQMTADYVVLTLPAPLLRRIPITPALPTAQHSAIASLRYGRATKTLLQFPRRFWLKRSGPKAFGSPLPFGAVWDANEEQSGRAGILSLLAGGSASDATHEIVVKEGYQGLARQLSWLGSKGETLNGASSLRWDAEPWSRGGYAVFDPAFTASARGWLAQPFGQIFFAGEHTSLRWQGYMNGAVESGRRAAAEIVASHRLSTA